MELDSKNAKIHCYRLTPGNDLKGFLRQWATENSILAATIISSVGSLKTVHVRLANSDKIFHSEEPHEIISLNGTLSRGGMHLHLAVADEKGTTWGGHLLDGNRIFTTCELVLMEIPNFEFVREVDPQTGFLELRCQKT
jgi:predicted DNA-binding protein with PD1-like motif